MREVRKRTNQSGEGGLLKEEEGGTGGERFRYRSGWRSRCRKEGQRESLEDSIRVLRRCVVA